MNEFKLNYKKPTFDFCGIKNVCTSISNYTKKININFIMLEKQQNIIIPNSVQYITTDYLFEKYYKFEITNNLKIQHINCEYQQHVKKYVSINKLFEYVIGHNSLHKTYYYYHYMTNIIFQHSLLYDDHIEQLKNIFLVETITNLSLYNMNNHDCIKNEKHIIIFKNTKNILVNSCKFTHLIKLRNIKCLYIYVCYQAKYYNYNLHKLCNIFKLCLSNPDILSNKPIKNHILIIDDFTMSKYDSTRSNNAKNKLKYNFAYVKILLLLNTYSFVVNEYNSINTIRVLFINGYSGCDDDDDDYSYSYYKHKHDLNIIIHKYTDYIVNKHKNI